MLFGTQMNQFGQQNILSKTKYEYKVVVELSFKYCKASKLSEGVPQML